MYYAMNYVLSTDKLINVVKYCLIFMQLQIKLLSVN